MRVTMSTIFHNIQNNLQNLAEDLQSINASISSGKKYQRISDNPVDVGAILGLTTEEGQTVQYDRNLETAKGWLSVTLSALQDITDIVRASTGLANQMATGTYNAAQRQAAAQQIQGYLEEIMQVGNTKFEGQHILAGYSTDSPPFIEGAWDIQPPVMHLQSGSTGTAVSGGTYTGTDSRTSGGGGSGRRSWSGHLSSFSGRWSKLDHPCGHSGRSGGLRGRHGSDHGGNLGSRGSFQYFSLSTDCIPRRYP